MNFKKNESATKLRGGYYTPPETARFLTRWAIKKRPKSILEPSCGDGVFIRAVHNETKAKVRLVGVEVIPTEAAKARQVFSKTGPISGVVHRSDFLEWALNEQNGGDSFGAVLGNPPYIRYQYLEQSSQKLAETIFRQFHLPFTKHTNAWVPFVIESIALLECGGRLAMVLPSEILHVLHAEGLRRFLLSTCDRICIIDPTELLFDEALQGTVLLLAEKKASSGEPSKGVAVISAANNSFLALDPEKLFQEATYVSGDLLNGKWMKVLLTPEELKVFERARKSPMVARFQDVAKVDVGIVTGANKFFLIDNATVKQFGLSKYARPMFGRSEHCPGVIYDDETHQRNQHRGLPSNFVMFGEGSLESLNAGARRYVALGEQRQLHTRYKCRIRSPWYAVPSVYATELGMLKRSHHYPRLILNTAGAYTTDTAYRIKSLTKEVTPEKLVYCFINSLTALSAELEGRHYGGGVLELVPSEIERLLIPLPPKLRVSLRDLNRLIIAGGNPDDLLAYQDEIVLAAAGIEKKDRITLQNAWRRVRLRRQRLEADEEEPDLQYA
jgi:adenine-specific DNA-methyltransferase